MAENKINIIIDILQRKDLKVTEDRVKVLNIFLTCDIPLKQSEIIHKLGGDIDRVTLYRTLNTFLESNIIRESVLDASYRKYELANSENLIDHKYCPHCGQAI